jgi:S-adenosylmethionine:tRNA ribosyltransferase-isomerase
MIAANLPIQRPGQAKLLVINASGKIDHVPRIRFVDFLRTGDLVIANDAATLPASLQGVHMPSGGAIEVRLAGRPSLTAGAVRHFSAVVFGPGDFRSRTEDRSLPPQLKPGDQLVLGPLLATVEEILEHPRLISLRFNGTTEAIWAGLARHGRPIQYSHIQTPLAMWDVWTPIAGPPVAFEPPSAGFALDWEAWLAIRARGVSMVTITHAAGISSTGDVQLDRHLPFDEPYRISMAAACAIFSTQFRVGRIIAIGTTVVRALEHAAAGDGHVHAGDGLATQRINADTTLSIVDAILTGTHEPGTSHYQLLRAFTDNTTLDRAYQELDARDYRSHEFGDSVFIEKQRHSASRTVGNKVQSVKWQSISSV